MSTPQSVEGMEGGQKKRVLFVCTHNSARSQMAEAWLNTLGGSGHEAESAGLEPTRLKEAVIQVMREAGMDLANKGTQSVFAVRASGRPFDYVVALFDEAGVERCPEFPAPTQFLRWEFPERPKRTRGTAEGLDHYRKVRDLIRQRIREWLAKPK